MKLFIVEISLEDNTYFEVTIHAMDAEEAMDKAVELYPNYISISAVIAD